LVTILSWIGYVVLGSGVVAAALIALPLVIAREINAGHELSCQCPACLGRRQRSWQVKKDRAAASVNPDRPAGQWRKDRKPPEHNAWISTLDLKRGMRVHGRASGAIFRVEAVEQRPFGYLVVLTNMMTGKWSRIPVQTDKAQHRIWLVRKPIGGGGLGV
jgi:hypothetical protein